MATEVKTEHPHVVRVEGVRGGRPVIKGSRILVSLIATYYKMGETPDDILRLYPHLAPAVIYDALSYYHDHRAEIDAELADTTLERVMEKYQLKMDAKGRLTPLLNPSLYCA